MLKYAKEKIETYFEGTIFLDTEDPYFSLRKIAIEVAQEDNGELKNYKSNFENYDTCLESWKNAVQSINTKEFLLSCYWTFSM